MREDRRRTAPELRGQSIIESGWVPLRSSATNAQATPGTCFPVSRSSCQACASGLLGNGGRPLLWVV